MLSDAAPYIIKSCVVLKVLYPNLIHGTCLAHELKVVEKVRDTFSYVKNW